MKTRNRYYLQKAILVYFLSLLLCSIVFYQYIMTWYAFVAGITSIILFYFLSVNWEKAWKNKDDKNFERNLFLSALLLRLCWVFLYYEFTNVFWGTPWEQPEGTKMDSYSYFYESLWAMELLDNGSFEVYLDWISQRLSDAGYPLLLLLYNKVSDSSILFTRIPNALFDSWTAVLVYRIAKRNFERKTAQLASIYTVLMPMLIFYSGVTMKESVMLMLTMWSLNLGDIIIRSRRLNVRIILSFVLVAGSLFFFREVLLWVMLLAFFGSYALSSPRVKQASQRTIILILVVTAVLIVAGGTILQQYEGIEAQLAMTEDNFINRSKENVLVKNLSKGMLFPFLFAIPFPTMVDIPGQYVQAIQNGGFFLKNIFSFFTVFGIVVLFIRGDWRNYSFLLEFLIGYLIVLGFSSFTHSGRFHHPVICIELIFAAYGLYAIKTIRQAKMFNIFFFIEIVIVIAWNWFKLAGRGLI